MKAEVFVSYSSSDRLRALTLVQRLQAEGVSVWVDQSGIDGARLWSQEIVEALDGCKAVILLLSATSAASTNVVKEVSIASEDKRPILPVRLEPVQIPSTLRYQLAGIQQLDLFEVEAPEGYKGIIRSLARLGVKVGVDDAPAPGDEAASFERVIARLGPPTIMMKRESFTEEALRKIVEKPLPVLLHGLAGAGKTTLLCEIARAAQPHFAHLLSVRFDGPAALEPGYLLEELNAFLASVGKAIDARRLAEQTPERCLEEVVRQLGDVRLLIFLDAADQAPVAWLETILRCLGAAPNVRIAVTTRQRLDGRLATQVLPVPALTDEEATAFVEQYARTVGLDLDPRDLIERLSPGLRSHPQGLATLLALLGDFPLELLLEAGIPDTARASSKLIEEAVAALDVPAREALALLDVLSGVQLQPAFRALRFAPPAGLLAALQVLLARALVQRRGDAYVVPAIVAEASESVDPDRGIAAARQLAEAWVRGMAANERSDRDFRMLALAGTQIAHFLSCHEGWDLVAGMTQESFLEMLNARGHWKEYAVLLRLGLEAAQRNDDRRARVRLGCRLARKLLQMADPQGARSALADVEGAVSASGDQLELAELHSHRALICEREGDADGAFRELQESLRIRGSAGDVVGVGVVEKLIGNLHLRRKQYREARAAYERALALPEDAAGAKHVIETQASVALCDLAEGALEAAEARLRSANERSEAVGYEAGRPRILLNLALVVERLGRPSEALSLAREAARRAEGNDAGVARAAVLVAKRLDA